MSFCFISTPLTINAENKEPNMYPDESLTLSVMCKDNPSCIYSGNRELFIEIQLTNNALETINFPFEYIKGTGPFITLKDNQTNHELPLRRNLASERLLNEITALAPKQSISFDWVIFDVELEQFRNQKLIDILAIIHIKTPVYKSNSKEPILFNEKATLHIKGN